MVPRAAAHDGLRTAGCLGLHGPELGAPPRSSWSGAAALLLLLIGIHNAWDAVMYQVFVKRRQQPVGGRPALRRRESGVTNNMRVGILGSGLMGAKLGTIFARAGHQVVFSYARQQAKRQELARHAGADARAGTPHDAVQGGDAVLLAVNWSRLDDVLSQAGELSGKGAHHVLAPDE